MYPIFFNARERKIGEAGDEAMITVLLTYLYVTIDSNHVFTSGRSRRAHDQRPRPSVYHSEHAGQALGVFVFEVTFFEPVRKKITKSSRHSGAENCRAKRFIEVLAVYHVGL